MLKRPVIDHWWQTETGWAITGNFRGLEYFPPKAGSASLPMPGYELKVLDVVTGEPVGPNTEGIIGVKLPLPPGNLVTLWQNEKGFKESYTDQCPGYYCTGDGGFFDV